jgi:ketosteroid isomerase-like protein
MQTLKEKIQHLNQLILQGKALDAFEMYYDDKVVMQENETVPAIGKEANRKREHEFFGNITEFPGASVLDLAVGDDVIMVIGIMITHTKTGENVITGRYLYNIGKMERS